MNRKTLPAIATALAFGIPLQGALITTGIYDEQEAQPNSVNFEMGYSSNATWTTGIGQTLGAAQIVSLADFKTNVADAFAAGRGGVITFDGVNPEDYNQIQSFSSSFAEGAKSLTFTNVDGHGGNYSINTGGGRTTISGEHYLGTGGNPHYNFDLTSSGFEAGENVVSIGVTLLGRNSNGTGRNFRVIAFYTDGINNGSSSTFRSFDMQNGNGTQDSFSGIVAPEGYWITRLRVHSDNSIFTSIDDLAFTTAIIPEPGTYALLFGALALTAATLVRRRRRL
jgi:hypothetical protein